MKKVYDPTWPSEQRIHTAMQLLPVIQLDIPAGRYSALGRPNIQSVMYVLALPAPELDEAMDGENMDRCGLKRA
jgi:hypothetical protein